MRKDRLVDLLPVWHLLFLLFFVKSAPVHAENSFSDTIRLMTYNVRNGLGMDTLIRYQRVAGIINYSGADVNALQELDSVTYRSNGVDVLTLLARETCLHATFGAAIPYQGGKYGVGLLSRETPLEVKRIPLPGREEKRVLLIAEFQNYMVGCTHFSTVQEDRMLSVPLIVECVKEVEKPFFLLGDMNADYDSPEQASLRENFIPLNDHLEKTFPSDYPTECIDYIYLYKNSSVSWQIVNARVLDEPVASDHRPVRVEIVLKKKD